MNIERVKLINILSDDPLLKNNFTNISFVELSSNEYTILTLFRKNRKSYQDNIMFYFCGYNDYFYHTYIFNYQKFNFDILVIDIPGFGFNKKYDNYKSKIKNNYYNDINKLNSNLDIVFKYIDNHRIYSHYKKRYLYAHSTGGNIIINYLYYLQMHNRLKNKFDKVILNSPLTRFSVDPQNKFPISWIIDLLFRYIINIIGLFSKNFDINIFNKIKILKYYRSKKYDKLNNKSLNLIYKTKNIIYMNSNFCSYCDFPMMIRWYICVEKSICRIIKSNKKININIKLIISKNDKILNYKYIKNDIKQLFKSSEIKVYDGIHDCLVTENYENVLDFILN
jgi:GTP-binding protein EngB required for normal cell division